LIWKKEIVEYVKPVGIPNKFLNKEISFVGFPLIAGSVAVVSSNDRRNILGFDLHSGKFKWHHLIDQDVEGIGSAFHMTSNGKEFWYIAKDYLRSIDMESGQVKSTFNIAANNPGKSRAIESVIVGVDLFAAFNEGRYIAAFNLQTGSLDWLEQCDSGFAAGCIWANEMLFAGDDQGTIYCYQ
jgi:outer membrane protein assembly factor BamB